MTNKPDAPTDEPIVLDAHGLLRNRRRPPSAEDQAKPAPIAVTIVDEIPYPIEVSVVRFQMSFGDVFALVVKFSIALSIVSIIGWAVAVVLFGAALRSL